MAAFMFRRVAPVLQSIQMSRHITQRELRNESGRIMRGLDRGKSFIVTRNGVPVGELIPLRQRVFVPADAVVAAFVGAPRIAFRRFRKGVDAVIDQDPTPRG
jgi:antitoxin (DNA-binding transcriptional repressor) of toxin-antitoxin stability system